ncbi:MAG: zinc ribbon domain-containing protein [Nitriliruptorales bacterium]|nr:zinc ribbon domain-containing protein [Nitriliruptorales bacterium]
MPIYAYACRACSERLELRASIAEKEAGLAPTCPACGSTPMRQLLTTFATRSSGDPQPASSAPAGAGCCGGGCCGA